MTMLILLLVSTRIHLRPPLNSTPPDPRRFRAIIDQTFPEPGMPEGLLRCEAFVGIVDEDFLEEVEEFFVEEVGGWDDFLCVILGR